MKRRKLKALLAAECETVERFHTLGGLLVSELASVVAELPLTQATAERLRTLETLARIYRFERMVRARPVGPDLADEVAKALIARRGAERGPGLRLVRGGA